MFLRSDYAHLSVLHFKSQGCNYSNGNRISVMLPINDFDTQSYGLFNCVFLVDSRSGTNRTNSPAIKNMNRHPTKTSTAT